MKHSSGVPRAALALAVALGCAGCGGSGAGRESLQAASTPDPAGGESVYALDIPLVDQDGRRLHLADLRGQVRVAAMMYASCKSVCPRVTQDMKGIQEQLSGARRERVSFVLFSLDPERDDPAALRAFARDHGLDPARWRLYSLPEESVRDLAAVLGVRYRKEEGGEFAHSAMIFVLDSGGVVRYRQVGLNADPSGLIAAMDRAR